MVSTSSVATQVNENEKRRKQTMEKVKANHLSRQLQMRLQYARLKVEHGWQKQNLNEVENLYFHNSHSRGAKPFPAPALATTNTQRQHSSFVSPQANVMQSSSLSFKLASSSLGRKTWNTNQNILDDPSMNTLERNETTGFQTQPVQNATFPMNANPPFNHNPVNDLLGVAAHSQPTRSSVIPTSSVPVVSNTSIPTEPINANQGDTPVPTTSMQSQDTESPIDASNPSPSNLNQPSPNKPPRSRASKAINGSKTTPSLTTRDLFNFGSTSTLTYDSFWSSHSGSTTPRPAPVRSPAIADLHHTTQLSVDLTSVTQEPSRSAVYSPPPKSQQPQ